MKLGEPLEWLALHGRYCKFIIVVYNINTWRQAKNETPQVIADIVAAPLISIRERNFINQTDVEEVSTRVLHHGSPVTRQRKKVLLKKNYGHHLLLSFVLLRHSFTVSRGRKRAWTISLVLCKATEAPQPFSVQDHIRIRHHSVHLSECVISRRGSMFDAITTLRTQTSKRVAVKPTDPPKKKLSLQPVGH